MSHVEFLSASEMNGRSVGSPEAYRAAQYIVDALEGYGLDAPPGGWLKEVEITLARPAEPPELALMDQDGGVLATFTRGWPTMASPSSSTAAAARPRLRSP